MTKKEKKEYVKGYGRTKKGLVTKIYSAQRYNSRERNHPMPLYKNKELQKWTLGQSKFHELFDNWVESDYNRMKIPSIDRIDDYKGYSFDNIQLMTFQENEDKSHSDRKYGINNKGSKTVLQFTKNGIFIKEYFSMSEASRQTNIDNTSISNVCLGKIKKDGKGLFYTPRTAGGYIWKLKEPSQ